MGLFDIFKPKNKKKDKNKQTISYADSDDKKRHRLFYTLNEIEDNKYINDKVTKQLYEKAYQQTKDNIIDRHFYYNNIIDYYYGLREKEEDALQKCIDNCIADIKITPQVIEEMKNSKMFSYSNEDGTLDFIPPRFPSFQRLAIIYEKQEEYRKAIDVCEKALEYGLKDGTKTGFVGRINRLKNKLNK